MLLQNLTHRDDAKAEDIVKEERNVECDDIVDPGGGKLGEPQGVNRHRHQSLAPWNVQLFGTETQKSLVFFSLSLFLFFYYHETFLI